MTYLRRVQTTLDLCIYQFVVYPFTQTARAYDSTRREVMGTLALELMIRPVIFQVIFQILRILVSFNLLLSHQWIRSVGAIPHSFHLKVKFIHDG